MARKKLRNNRIYLITSAVIVLISSIFIFRKSFRQIPCANTLSCEESLKLSIDNKEKAVFEGKTIEPPDIHIALENNINNVLGSETQNIEKHIYVDLTNQTLKAYEGDTLFMETKISSGKWFPTPNGDFRIWRKIRSTKMSGGEGADYYYLPNVPFVMYFSNSKIAPSRGFALHGTYWHNNFGHAMSHGCVNMRTIDAQKLYYWANPWVPENGSSSAKDAPGTVITIYGKAP